MKFYGKPTRCSKSTMFLNTKIMYKILLSIYAMNVICNSVFLF